MRIVLDSNVLLVALGKRSRYKLIWQAFIEGVYKVVVSEDILHEYEEILMEHAAPGIADLVLESFVESPDVIISVSSTIGTQLSLILMIINFSMQPLPARQTL
jgi:predicted nucleic acid-binding protein